MSEPKLPASTAPPQAQSLHLAAHELATVRAILHQHIPEKHVWAFGSRATGGRMLKRFSDLDLAVEGRLTGAAWAALVDAFDESPLPMKIDLVQLDMVDEAFRLRIAKDFVAVQRAAVPA